MSIEKIKTKVFKLLNTKTKQTYFIEVYPNQQIVAIEFLVNKQKQADSTVAIEDYVYIKLPTEEMKACWKDTTKSCYAVKSIDVLGLSDPDNAIIPEIKPEKPKPPKVDQQIDRNRALKEFHQFMNPKSRYTSFLSQTNGIVENSSNFVKWDFGFPLGHFIENNTPVLGADSFIEKSNISTLYRFKSFAEAYWYVRKNLIDTQLSNEPYIKNYPSNKPVFSEFTNLEQLDSLITNVGHTININNKQQHILPQSLVDNKFE